MLRLFWRLLASGLIQAELLLIAYGLRKLAHRVKVVEVDALVAEKHVADTRMRTRHSSELERWLR